MFDKNLLLRIIFDPAEVRDVYTKAKEHMKPVRFPKNACATTCSLFLRRSGLNIPIEQVAETLAGMLKGLGWSVIDRGQPALPGYVFVTVDDNHNGLADHIGIVAAPLDAQQFYAVDNQLKPPEYKSRVRNIYRGRKTAVAYWLRAPLD